MVLTLTYYSEMLREATDRVAAVVRQFYLSLNVERCQDCCRYVYGVVVLVRHECSQWTFDAVRRVATDGIESDEGQRQRKAGQYAGHADGQRGTVSAGRELDFDGKQRAGT